MSAQIQKNFNNAYIVAKHKPELFAQLVKGMEPSSEHHKLLVAAQREVDLEKRRIEKASKAISKDKSHDKDRDR